MKKERRRANKDGREAHSQAPAARGLWRLRAPPQPKVKPEHERVRQPAPGTRLRARHSEPADTGSDLSLGRDGEQEQKESPCP